jgi:hypothetical protein
MQTQLREIAVQIGGQGSGMELRTESFDGTEYLVAPLVMLVEGVIQGANSSQPEFCPALELDKAPQGWNGRPLVMNHPQLNGEFVSANIPQVLEEWAFGHIFNASVSSGKLKGEAWIDTGRAAERGGDFQDAVDRINSGELVEVSTGLFTQVIPSKGRYNNSRYSGVWSGIVPDHLAILSKGVTGACSIEDGCGIPRLNQIAAWHQKAPGPVNTSALRVHAQPVDQSTAAVRDNCSCEGDGAPPVGVGTMGIAAAVAAAVARVLTPGVVGGPAWDPAPIDGGKVGGGDGPVRTTEMAGAGISPTQVPTQGTGTGVTVPSSVDTDFDAAEDYDEVYGDPEATSSAYRPPRPADTSFVDMAKRSLAAYGKHVRRKMKASNEARPDPDPANPRLQLRGNALDSTVVFSDVAQILSSALADQYEALNGYMYVAAVTTDVVVVCTYDNDWSPVCYQIGYSMDANGNVSFTGEPEPVIMMTRIVAQPDSGVTANQGSTAMNDKNTPAAPVVPVVATAPAATPPEPTVAAAAAAAASPTVLSVEEYIAQAPAGIREMMSSSMRLFQQRKDTLIAAIKANQRNKFSDERLATFSVEDLEVLADLAFDPPPLVAKPLTEGRGGNGNPPNPAAPAANAAPPNYSGRAAPTADGPVVMEDQGGAPPPPKVFEGRPPSRFQRGAGLNAGAGRRLINPDRDDATASMN